MRYLGTLTGPYSGTTSSPPGHLLPKPERVLEVLKGRLGGGFGRRTQQDFLAEAMQIAQTVEFQIKFIWSRDEGIQHDFYRPFTLHRLSATLDGEGYPLSWSHRIVGPGEEYFSRLCRKLQLFPAIFQPGVY